MCGIVGYKGPQNASEIVFSGLKKLEYRGYDSWGMALKNSNSGLSFIKQVGKLPQTYKIKKSCISIGHTRWATHGAVTKENAHPHPCCNGKIAVVHNGIIENWATLKKELVKRGHCFHSGTDTEVISHLIEEYMKKQKKCDFADAVKKSLSRLEGSWAIMAVHSDSDAIIAARKDSPLVIGIGENGEYFPASDIPAILEHTKKVMYLYDYDVAILDGKPRVWNLKSKRDIRRVVDTIDWGLEQAKKGDFAHYMLKEISEQTDTIKRAIEQDPATIKKIASEINKAGGVFFVGCGTSHHACLSASYFFSKITNRHVNVVLASEFPNYEHFLTSRSLIIAVSQSGETADVLEAVKVAKRKGSKVLSIVNVRGSSLARESDSFLLMHAGPEICVIGTKTYTSHLALLLLLAYACAGKYDEGKAELEKAWNLTYDLTARSTREHIKKLAMLLKNKQHIFTIGRDLQYPTALEAALKIKEVSYIHAEGFAGGELKHGTIALIEEGTPCIVFLSKDMEAEILSNAQEIKARGGYIIGVGPRNNEVFDYWIKVPDLGNANSLAQIIPIQILAYKLAVLKGLDPDKPRNLAKTVTVK